jgi:hypothetical protein
MLGTGGGPALASARRSSSLLCEESKLVFVCLLEGFDDAVDVVVHVLCNGWMIHTFVSYGHLDYSG